MATTNTTAGELTQAHLRGYDEGRERGRLEGLEEGLIRGQSEARWGSFFAGIATAAVLALAAWALGVRL